MVVQEVFESTVDPCMISLNLVNCKIILPLNLHLFKEGSKNSKCYLHSLRKTLSSLGLRRVKPYLNHWIISPELWWCDYGKYFSFNSMEVDRKFCLDEQFLKSQTSMGCSYC